MAIGGVRGTLLLMLKTQWCRMAVIAAACGLSAGSVWAQNSPVVSGEPTPEPQLTVRDANGHTVPTTVPADASKLPEAQKFVAREFGPGYQLAQNQPVLLGDLDGDGREDAVFIVTGTSPLIGAGAFHYTVLDPYDGYWSFSDPNLNTHISQTDPGPHYYLLVAHDWRGETPKAKFVFINLPFQRISLTPTTLGSSAFKKNKKVVAAIATIESDGQEGAVFWTGKTYKFVQLGNTED